MTMIERNHQAEQSPFFWIGRSVLIATRSDSGGHAAQSPASSWIGTALGKIFDVVHDKARKHRHHKALLQLKDMEDWQLNDIGVTRSAVEDALFARK